MQFFLSSFGKYYVIDWIAVITMVSSMYFLGRQHRAGFIFGALSSLSWIVFGVIVWSVADISANVLCFGLNIWGFWKWSRKNVPEKNSAFPSPVEIGFLTSDRWLLSA